MFYYGKVSDDGWAVVGSLQCVKADKQVVVTNDAYPQRAEAFFYLRRYIASIHCNGRGVKPYVKLHD